MPLYEYECEKCHARFEAIQRFSDSPIEMCRVCGAGPVHRLISPPAIHFKGTGWYVTDYAKKNSGPANGAASSSSTDSSSSSDTKPSPPKTTDTGATTTKKE